jgi:hypothetical protein
MSLLYVVNPKRRTKTASKKRRRKAARRAAPAAAAAPKRRRRGRKVATLKSRSYRKNPRFSGRGIIGNVTGALVPAAIAGAGALGVDVLLGYLPLPDKFKTGALRHVTRAAGAIALGIGAGFVLKKETANQIMAGGLTVAAHGAMRDALARFAPSVPLAELEDESVGDLEEDLNALLANESAGMGGFETFAPSTMQGVFNPGFES